MAKYRKEFEEAIQTAKANGVLDERVRLIQLGRLDYAVGHGDLSINEAEALEEMMEPGISRRYARELEIVLSGTPEEESRPMRKSA